MYLAREQIYNLFEEISTAVASGSVIVFDTLATKYDANGNQYPDMGLISPFVRVLLKLKTSRGVLGWIPKSCKTF